MARYNIVVQRLINDQPAHIFVQHKGIREGKVDELFNEVVKEQYDRLERAKDDIEVRFDHVTPFGTVMLQRGFRDGAVASVQIIAEKVGA